MAGQNANLFSKSSLMSYTLLAESGSTKTDWCLVGGKGKPVICKTSGMNPLLQSAEQTKKVLAEELNWDHKKYKIDKVCFYGAGAGSKQRQDALKAILKEYFRIKDIDVQGDMLGAARGLCGSEQGVVAILGTGSNSCYYNGEKIKEQRASLGFIAGDEGSGNHMGKRVLQYYAYKTFDTELLMSFEQLFGDDLQAIIQKLYRESFPNRYLAQFVQLLVQNRGHYMVENIIEDCINDFFQAHILKYRQSWKFPLYFTGSVAWAFKDVIADLCQSCELELGGVEQSPLKGLIEYHRG